ncbi:hypothetical protein AV530_007684 [Patagioenas fasciata monilis]|uniref:Uncharacterized protein n=1 Tax=Patagioenas fasciata monilis TaxID=372326 RepID=A0A1V4JYW7_PATFA|nr:hypothetical protein AV530_007684 [Patagioenas fasciata monilis]
MTRGIKIHIMQMPRSFHLDKVVVASVSLWLTDRARASLTFRYIRKLKVYGNWDQTGTELEMRLINLCRQRPPLGGKVVQIYRITRVTR